MVNMARHNLFGDPVFTDNIKSILQLQEFLGVIKSHYSHPTVSIMSLCPYIYILIFNYFTAALGYPVV